MEGTERDEGAVGGRAVEAMCDARDGSWWRSCEASTENGLLSF